MENHQKVSDALADIVRQHARTEIRKNRAFHEAYDTQAGRGQKRVNKVRSNRALGPFRENQAIIGASTGSGVAGP